MSTNKFTLGIFEAYLKRHDFNKPVCFCRSITGLNFYRFKMRGERLLQMEFNESIYRDRDGRLMVDLVFPPIDNPIEFAPTVGSLLSKPEEADCKNFSLFFGGSEDALTFVDTEDFGDWVSINFEQRVYRNDLGGITVEEMRNGRVCREDFRVSEFTDLGNEKTLGPSHIFTDISGS